MVAANGIRKTGSDGALLQGPAANSGIRRRAHGPTGSATGVTGGTGTTGATGGSAKKNSKNVFGQDTGKKVVDVCGACMKDTQTFELHKQFKKKVEASKLAAHMEVYCKDRLIKALGRKKRKADSKIVANFMLNAANGSDCRGLEKPNHYVGPWQGH